LVAERIVRFAKLVGKRTSLSVLIAVCAISSTTLSRG
jgi:hypothetical protein